jgi:hypothetical protein
MFPRSIGMATTNAISEFKVQRVPRVQDLAAQPKGSAVRGLPLPPSAAVRLKGANAPAFDGVDYADKLRRNVRADGGGAGAIYAPWLVGDVAGQDAPEGLGSQPLTTGFIIGASAPSKVDIARFGPLGSITAEPMPPGAEGPVLQLGPDLPGAPDDPATARPWEAALMFGGRPRDAAVGSSAVRERSVGAQSEPVDLADPPLPPLLPQDAAGEGFAAAAATPEQAQAHRASAPREQRFWNGTEFVPVKGQSVDQLLLKIIASDSLLDKVRQERATSRGGRAAVEASVPSTVSLSGLAPGSAPHGRSEGTAMYLSPARGQIDARV